MTEPEFDHFEALAEVAAEHLAKQRCGACNGGGIDPGIGGPCKRCNGSGKVSLDGDDLEEWIAIAKLWLESVCEECPSRLTAIAATAKARGGYVIPPSTGEGAGTGEKVKCNACGLVFVVLGTGVVDEARAAGWVKMDRGGMVCPKCAGRLGVQVDGTCEVCGGKLFAMRSGVVCSNGHRNP